MTVHEAPREIEMPASTPMGLVIAVCAGALGFGMVWHMWWLSVLALLAIAACLALRSFETGIERPMHI
jgi:cytochrome o ubiquinol oxidase subunit 1